LCSCRIGKVSNRNIGSSNFCGEAKKRIIKCLFPSDVSVEETPFSRHWIGKYFRSDEIKEMIGVCPQKLDNHGCFPISILLNYLIDWENSRLVRTKKIRDGL
jgi:hypothetical protein